jgi:glycosyltransferase involved in cell wall biosynthesis
MPLIASSLAQAGIEVDIATTDDDGRHCRLNTPLAQRIEQNGYGVFYFRKQTEFYKVSLSLSRWLLRHVRDYDAVHIHALFQFASISAARCARRAGVPYVIRPLGVLNRYGMTRRRPWLKRFSFRLIEQPIIRSATAIHYTSDQERIEAEDLGVLARPFIIPLGIDLSSFKNLPLPDLFFAKWPQVKNRKIVLFLSRLDAKKGLDLLIEAWARLNREQWVLVIAGKGEELFERGLLEQAARFEVKDNIIWAGFLQGKEKLAAFSAASLFVLPSHSENFGIAIAEALACRLPVIASRGTPWSDLIDYKCGWWVDNRPKVLAETLEQAMILSEDERQLMGTCGRELVEKKYSWPAIAEQMKSLYEWILKNHRGEVVSSAN